MAGLYASPKPMAWVIGLLLAGIVYPGIITRLMLGRPFLLTGAVAIALFKLWQNMTDNNIWSKKLLFSVVMIATAVWIHGSWYLLLLVPFAFFLAGQHRASIGILVSITLGTIIASIMTGAPLDFFRFHFIVPLRIFSENLLNRQLVIEFQSMRLPFSSLTICVLVVIALVQKCRFKLADLTVDPVFMLMVTGLLLGVNTRRFWLDWGLLAMILWLALKISDLIKNSDSLASPRVRYCLTIFFCVLLIFVYTHDAGGRFSNTSFFSAVQFDDPQLHGWEPGEDGIIYSDNMTAFYAHYYAYPNAKWKYAIGYEPVLMPEENLVVYRDILFHNRRDHSFEPWIKKMRPQDRIFTSKILNGYKDIEWIRGSLHFMIGRLKQKNEQKQN
jgi:hypothetical protein